MNTTPQLFANDSIDGELATLNLGPTHPATHGIFKMF
jgi:NADH-quinone oxidoreductase subunit D